MVIGLVNSELMALTEAIGVIIGANIGTTITGWILALKIGQYGLPLLGLASFGWLFPRRKTAILGPVRARNRYGLFRSRDHEGRFRPGQRPSGLRGPVPTVRSFRLRGCLEIGSRGLCGDSHRPIFVGHVGDDDRSSQHGGGRFSNRGCFGFGYEHWNDDHGFTGVFGGGRYQRQTYRLLSHILQRYRRSHGHGSLPSCLSAFYRERRYPRRRS